MRIEAYKQVHQIYKKSKMDVSQKRAGLFSSDQLELSSTGREYQVAKQAVAAVPEVREEVIAPLRSRIQNGSYEVSAESFVDKLLQKMEEMR